MRYIQYILLPSPGCFKIHITRCTRLPIIFMHNFVIITKEIRAFTVCT